MPVNYTRLTELLNRYANATSTQVEENELFDLLNNNPEQDIEPVLIELLENTEPVVDFERRERILGKVFSLEAGVGSKVKSFVPRNDRTVVRLWKRIAVAASILLVAGLGSYFLFFNKPGKQTEIVKTPEVVPGDVKAPETNRAMITLADGRQVYLDEVGNGELALQGNVKLVKLANGKIVYEASPSPSEGGGQPVYNTLSNPRGSKVIDMTLSDGSHVWLNAGSSVTYPVAFVGSERKVSITGEAYFEVNSQLSMVNSERMPFIVSKGGMRVTVLGTHFNVNAYDDEDVIKVTLLEGSVNVSNNQSSLIIKPNQQALVRGNAAVALNNNVDVEAVMAWKNGFFSFDNSDLQTVMKQIARWYDVEVVYEGKVPDMRFGGEISRSSTAAQVLKILEKSKVQFRIEGKKIVVKK